MAEVIVESLPQDHVKALGHGEEDFSILRFLYQGSPSGEAMWAGTAVPGLSVY